MLTDASRNVTDTLLTDAWGVEVAATGATVNPFRAFGAWGYYWDNASRLYVRARDLRVDLGRWVSRDPIGFEVEDANRYGYVGNQPLGLADPSGQKPWRPTPSDEACYEKVYKKRQKKPSYNCPHKACQVANQQCHSRFLCGPCGRGSIGNPGGCTSASRFADKLHRNCGGDDGADKLAHCYLACMFGVCAGLLWGWVSASVADRFHSPDPKSDKPWDYEEHKKANHAGAACAAAFPITWAPGACSALLLVPGVGSMYAQHCLACCVKATDDLRCTE